MEKPHYVVVVRPGVELIDSVEETVVLREDIARVLQLVNLSPHVSVHVHHTGSDADGHGDNGSHFPEAVERLRGEDIQGVKPAKQNGEDPHDEDQREGKDPVGPHLDALQVPVVVSY